MLGIDVLCLGLHTVIGSYRWQMQGGFGLDSLAAVSYLGCVFSYLRQVYHTLPQQNSKPKYDFIKSYFGFYKS